MRTPSWRRSCRAANQAGVRTTRSSSWTARGRHCRMSRPLPSYTRRRWRMAVRARWCLAVDMPDRWLLLIHQIPPKPDYFRVKVRRRLYQLGAIAIKNSVYVLPHSDEMLEDFQWLAREIEQEGGEA